MKKFDFTECKIAKTPMHPICTIGKDEERKKVNQKIYIGMIESLIYLTAYRPDIMSSVCLPARFFNKILEDLI